MGLKAKNCHFTGRRKWVMLPSTDNTGLVSGDRRTKGPRDNDRLRILDPGLPPGPDWRQSRSLDGH